MTIVGNRVVYLDNAATTRLDKSVFSRMKPFFLAAYGNPSSLHYFGLRAREAIEKARKEIALDLRCSPDEIIFTSGGTEANNLALRGIAYARKEKGNHIITSVIEHPSILEVCTQLEREGFSVTYLPVDKTGFVSPEQLRAAITPTTILISLMHANNEIGTIQPLPAFAAIAREKGVLFHTDAVQSYKKASLQLDSLFVDACSFSAHKIHGPKGIGALFLRRGTPIHPTLLGGEQELGLRPGTENVPAIVGFGEAATKEIPTEKMKILRDYFVTCLLALPGTTINGHQEKCLPYIISVSFAGIEAETLLEHLTSAGIMASMGSACHAHKLEPSHVLTALGLPQDLALGTIRLTLSKYTTKKDLVYALEIIKAHVSSLRLLGRAT